MNIEERPYIPPIPYINSLGCILWCGAYDESTKSWLRRKGYKVMK